MENALNTLDRLQRMSAVPTPALARASANMAMARVSAVNLRRNSLTAMPASDLEGGIKDINNVVDEMQAAADEVAGQVPEENRAELLENIADVQKAVANLQRVSAVVLKEGEAPGPSKV